MWTPDFSTANISTMILFMRSPTGSLLPFQSLKEDLCKTHLQWNCGVELGTEPFVLFPNPAPQCH